MTSGEGETRITTKRDAFASVAFWQLMAFVFLLCFVWASEVLDLPARVFDAEPTPFNLYRACMLSAAIITAGVVAVGHTYERQRAMIRNLLMTCLYCHRVKNEDGSWEHVEQYFMRNFPVSVDRGACPDCDQMLKTVADIEVESKAKK